MLLRPCALGWGRESQLYWRNPEIPAGCLLWRSRLGGAPQVRQEAPRARRLSQCLQRLSFDLARTLPGDSQAASHFLERMFVSILQPETHADDLGLARREIIQHIH